jgi:hypothetical protein
MMMFIHLLFVCVFFLVCKVTDNAIECRQLSYCISYIIREGILYHANERTLEMIGKIIISILTPVDNEVKKI